ncbi:lon-related putative ATP-dependent protease [Desulfocicer vacuolatum DSM 3385]|uniref:endopeptidase La n=1 Tax=Desulfocicer vacuolatum DSM 3385 TaxID=1121400 RepID=A0A1W2AQZ5_9BACT|nr:ATP-binding protein [Desulfocicer vacuolatum]SMC63137.1 lon-related putative ATP-dependent protease [Desulfocicer vacuolatum DSM 3385]
MPLNNRILPEDLTMEYTADQLPFEDTSQLPPLDGVIGQKRAVEAIAFGLNMKGCEYNIFVTGVEGTGKTTILKRILKEHAAGFETPPDLCMVNNFEDSYSPIVMALPPGTALRFRREMKTFIQVLKVKIPIFLGSDTFQEKQRMIQQEHAKVQKKLFETVETLASSLSLGIAETEEGYQIVPLESGKPVAREVYDTLSPEKLKEIEENTDKVTSALNEAVQGVGKSGEQMKAAMKKMMSDALEGLVAKHIDPVRSSFRECRQIQTYLETVKDDIIENMAMFSTGKDAEPENGPRFKEMAHAILKTYEVNVLVDRKREKGAPVVFESHPTFKNLFGSIEKKPVMGAFAADFTMVQAGSVLRANGGYLVLQIEPLLTSPYIWETLKTTLRNSSLRIEDGPESSAQGMPSLKPEPVHIDLKVILVGGYAPFRLLQSADSGFNKIFKVRADFDHEAWCTDETLKLYTRFIAGACDANNLRHFTRDGVWAVIEFARRLVADRRKLSLRFGRILGMIKEADYWAGQEQADRITREHVQRAVAQHRFRYNLYEDKMLEKFDDQSVLMDVSGKEIGQVNALAVYDMGDIAFGRPTRITAESYMGTPGIINVEREASLSGETHDKGMMIVSGYLGRMFAKGYPLSVSISITFEQSYDGIDGDSASSTELYAVLSSLSGIPIRQDIAVTGSVNQKGEIQAIGGVNEKIEGFFDVCTKKGREDSQGVMIPAANANNLVLRQDVMQAIKEKQFHIYKISRIEEGIELLTGIPAGVADEALHYPSDTVFGKVQARLEAYHLLSMSHGG